MPDIIKALIAIGVLPMMLGKRKENGIDTQDLIIEKSILREAKLTNYSMQEIALLMQEQGLKATFYKELIRRYIVNGKETRIHKRNCIITDAYAFSLFILGINDKSNIKYNTPIGNILVK